MRGSVCIISFGLISAFLLFGGQAAAQTHSDESGSFLQLHGTFMPGGMLRLKFPPEDILSIVFNGENLHISTDGRAVLGFGRNARQYNYLDLISPDLSEHSFTIRIEERTYETQRIDGLPSKKVTPSPNTYKRISNERTNLRRILTQNISDQQGAFETFLLPIEGIVTGVYGSRRILNGQPRQPHYGVDIAAALGTPIKAPASGVVVFVDDMYFSGLTAVIDHGLGLMSLFFHLDKVTEPLGSVIDQSTVFAEVGATGRVTGASSCR